MANKLASVLGYVCIDCICITSLKCCQLDVLINSLLWCCVSLAKRKWVGRRYASMVHFLPVRTPREDLNCSVYSGFIWSSTMKLNQFSTSNSLVIRRKSQKSSVTLSILLTYRCIPCEKPTKFNVRDDVCSRWVILFLLCCCVVDPYYNGVPIIMW